MFIILLLPFYLLGKLIMYLTNYCCLKEKEAKTLNEIELKLKSDYKIFNPCDQKKELKRIFFKFTEDKDKLLNKSQYKEIEDKIDRLKHLDLDKLQKNMRIPRDMTFYEKKLSSYYYYESNYIEVTDEKKKKLYHFLMRLGFISYLEEGNVVKPKKKKVEFSPNKIIRSNSLRLLSLQENLSYSGAGNFTIYTDNDDIKMAYVDNNTNIKIFDVFHKQVLKEVKGLKHTKKIVCVDYFINSEQNEVYLFSIALDNTMIISNVKTNENITVENIGDNFKHRNNDSKNTFCISTVLHNGIIWVITSYYYDNSFKIYDSKGNHLHTVPLQNNDEVIISLEGLELTQCNTYIVVRSASYDGKKQRISLFINEYFIKNIEEETDYYLNFKVTRPFDLLLETIYIAILKIKKDLSSYCLEIIDISKILRLYTPIMEYYLQYFNQVIMSGFNRVLPPGTRPNQEALTPMNEDLRNKIRNNPNYYYMTSIFTITQYYSEDNGRRNEMIKFFQSDNIEKYNIGNLLFWDCNYIIVGTPFAYLDIIDFDNKEKVGVINNSENIANFNDKGEKEENDIVIYNISKPIFNREYGLTFIMRDNKGKIQYIRPSRLSDKLNYKIIKSDEYFNDLADEIKLEHINFSKKFYFYYTITSNIGYFIGALLGHNSDDPNIVSDDELYSMIVLFIVYFIISFWFKGCVYDIQDETHTQRTCTKKTIYFFLVIKAILNAMLSSWLCYKNKTGIIFMFMIIIIYLIQLIFNYIVYRFKIKYLLRTYWLGFIFYQISRLVILVFFAISVIAGANNIETYIYALILCVISAYMYLANYFNTLLKEITYSNITQALFNYPMEWMNLICCWFTTPKYCIRELDYQFCTCDTCFLSVFEFFKTLMISIAYVFVYIIMAIFCSLSNSDSSNENN